MISRLRSRLAGLWFSATTHQQLVGPERRIGAVHARMVASAVSVLALPFAVSAQGAFDLMARQLLEKRFGVVLRKEQREEQVYAMRLARSDGRTGPDLRRSPEVCLENPPPRTTPKSSTGSAPEYSGWCATLTSLAAGLSRYLQAEVVDQTGLPGRWDFTLAFANPSPDAVPSVEAQANLPTIFAAVEEQLGFRLERNARGVVEYVSLAAAHPPTEN
jgi:uncharacterized protein (TIGR03435 family)